MTLDGVGEWATSTVGIGEGNRLQLTHEIQFPIRLAYSIQHSPIFVVSV